MSGDSIADNFGSVVFTPVIEALQALVSSFWHLSQTASGAR
jgi:hypothetical protein